ncbi:SDR family NAD(P)-dependent oxidoreductase [Collinsella tanakaei]|uniref:SDR family NAD(P)-dependent oxidoreductase n=1 Tax=Collinsella tanakaei TaxID=626935 RepID=UPI00195EC9AD
MGAAIAKLFAAEGAKVVMSARRAAALEEVAAQIAEAGGEPMGMRQDSSRR